MYAFGLAGYLWAYEDTKDNILLNFDPSDKIILIGRIGCGITTLFALPMNLVPCREAMLSLVAQLSEISVRNQTRRRRKPQLPSPSEEHQSLLSSQRCKDDSEEGGGEDLCPSSAAYRSNSHSKVFMSERGTVNTPVRTFLPPRGGTGRGA